MARATKIKSGPNAGKYRKAGKIVSRAQGKKTNRLAAQKGRKK